MNGRNSDKNVEGKKVMGEIWEDLGNSGSKYQYI